MEIKKYSHLRRRIQSQQQSVKLCVRFIFVFIFFYCWNGCLLFPYTLSSDRNSVHRFMHCGVNMQAGALQRAEHWELQHANVITNCSVSGLWLVETTPFNNTKNMFADYLFQTQDFPFSSSKISVSISFWQFLSPSIFSFCFLDLSTQ